MNDAEKIKEYVDNKISEITDRLEELEEEIKLLEAQRDILEAVHNYSINMAENEL